MIIAYWVGIVVAAAGIAYVTQFAGATLSLGRALSDSQSERGFQDAVTPPWQSKFAMLVYSFALFVIAGSWYLLGFLWAPLAIVLIFVGAILVRRLLPKVDGDHFKHLIVRSMASRYANFVRDGDAVRADAMKMLLRRTGVDPDAVSGA